ncbi:MAG: pentapeptide repeat-containing protein [Cyanobacteria bacterium P01_A01_bin.84]
MNPYIEPDLTSANLEGIDLFEFNLSNGSLIHGNFGSANLRNTDLSNAHLEHADLTGADLRNADLRNAHLEEAKLGSTDLSNADLNGANLNGADLGNADLSNANLNGADFIGANFLSADFIGASLVNADFTKTQINSADFSNAKLIGVKLTGLRLTSVKLTNADLEDADLSNTDLRDCDLSCADLRNANLSMVQALGTNFSGATLNGACIEDWNINSETNLENITCHYIYLKNRQQERRPSDPNRNFEPGEFAKLVQKSVETVDLIFSNGIDWKAFLSSYEEVQVEYGEQNVSIQAIEKKSDGAFVIRLNVPPDANKAEIESKAIQSYETRLKVLETQYREKLKAKDDQIAIHRQHNTDLLDIIKLKASQPLTANHFHVSVGSVDNKGTQTNISGKIGGN